MKRTYADLDVDVKPLRIKQSDLNTKRMLDLMAVKQDDGPTPLYVHTINRILREMRIVQQESGIPFKLGEFKRQVACAGLMPTQLVPLNQRLDTLESFLAPEESDTAGKKRKQPKKQGGTDWHPQVQKFL